MIFSIDIRFFGIFCSPQPTAVIPGYRAKNRFFLHRPLISRHAINADSKLSKMTKLICRDADKVVSL
jgi:hypothetical protein